MLSAPGPKYSTMAPVPPLTVRISATFRITSFGLDQPESSPVRWTPISFGPADVEREAGHHVDGVGAADADGHHAEAPGVGGVAVGADHHPAREGVVLEHDLVDDARSRLPEADAVAGRHRPEELVDLAVAVEGELQVEVGAGLGQDEVVAVDRGRHRRLVETGGHELQQRHLGRGVLHGDPVRVEVGVADGRGPVPASSGERRWLSRTFSVKVRGRPRRRRPRATRSARRSYTPRTSSIGVDDATAMAGLPTCVLSLSRQDYTSDGTQVPIDRR